jgi:UDP-N-acetylglucosamine 3-dehydrogenase
MQNLKAAIIGLGAMGKNHARVIDNLAEVELVAAFDSAPKLFEGKVGIPLVQSIDLLISKNPDYCVIATPTSTHEELALLLLKAGIHVLIEKPIAISTDAASNIIRCADENGLIGGVGHIERFNSALVEAKRRILCGELGSIYQISTRRLGPFPTRVNDVGVTIDLATHDIDLTKWLSNSEYTSVSAQSTMRSGNQKDDLITVTGKLKNGVIVSHNVNWLSPLKERKTIITGELGTFVVDTLSSDLTYYENGSLPTTQREIAHFRGVTQGQVTVFAFEKPEPLIVEHQEFVKALKGEASNFVSLLEARNTLSVAEGILESSMTGLTVFL